MTLIKFSVGIALSCRLVVGEQTYANGRRDVVIMGIQLTIAVNCCGHAGHIFILAALCMHSYFILTAFLI